MARRERKVAWKGSEFRLAKSGGLPKNPRKHAGTVAIGQEKAPTEKAGVY